MGVRIASLEDKDIVLMLCGKFREESQYKEFVNPERLNQLAEFFLNGSIRDQIIFLYDDIGILVAMRNRFIYGTEYGATELAWFVEKEHRSSSVGSELMEAFETWAKRMDCKYTVMTSSLDERVDKFYQKSGYKLYERSYFKEI